MASVDPETLLMERNAIKGTLELAKALNDSPERLVSVENLPDMVAAYELVISAMTANSMKEFPDARDDG